LFSSEEIKEVEEINRNIKKEDFENIYDILDISDKYKIKDIKIFSYYIYKF
jgi:hypothetical protein